MDTERIDKKCMEKIKKLDNRYVAEIIAKYADLCRPSKVTLLDDSEESIDYIRHLALRNNEERALNTKGHTIHFDGYYDQGRDLVNTRVLLPKGKRLSKYIETMDRDEGLKEIFGMLDGIMQGKEMLVKFYCLGPNNSKFSIPALQLTDSAYVVHSEDMLYRQGYEDFKRLNGSKSFFHFVHSAGRLENSVSADIGKRRVYMDLEEERVFTINNQYAGNSVGLKKLALRLAISKANKEDWLCEHMFVMGVHPNKNRVTYFTGAFPSGCGKTSTAMVPGQTIIGDDIAYIRPDEKGNAMSVNVEQGIFGIIEDVNQIDDPLIYNVLTTPRELIFSNVLVESGTPYWLGMGKELPKGGINHSGEWFEGKQDKDGKTILAAHKNARYTVRINELENADSNIDNPQGVHIKGFIYGGRDSDTSMPVLQSLSWPHGVFVGAALESETTATTTQAVGVRKHNPMSNIEFLTVPLGIYIKNHLRFGESLNECPLVFATNYFLKENGKFLNEKTDKKVWLLWMEGRIHGDYGAIETPVGYIPEYSDIRQLFNEVFSKEFTRENYEKQFCIKTAKWLEKMSRIESIFKDEEGVPSLFYEHLEQQRKRLEETRKKFNKDTISPFDLQRI